MKHFKKELEKILEEISIPIFGISEVKNNGINESIYKNWIYESRHGKMSYLENQIGRAHV